MFLIVENKTCDLCHKNNSELSQFTMKVPVSHLSDRVQFRVSSWIRRIIKRYVYQLLYRPIDVEVKVCQSCSSTIFRSFRKGK